MCSTDMYLIRFLLNFMVFFVFFEFREISRIYLNFLAPQPGEIPEALSRTISRVPWVSGV